MLVPYKKWLLAKQRRRLSGSWDRDMRPPSNGTDCMDLCDVVHSPQFKARFAEIIGMGIKPDLPPTASESHRKLGAVAASTVEHGTVATTNTGIMSPVRGRAVPCIDVDDTKGHTPKGED